ncbi:FixC protein [Salmonella enterica subsp. enterica serovar Paratyphi A]|nr:FixC protein [Salmonella enterica subsp. enterica serovar Paratyphi A]
MKRDDFSKQSLGEYRQHLDEGPMRDMRMYQKLPAFLIIPAFTAYPEMAVSIARDCSPWMAPRRCPCVKKSCAMRRKWASST